MPHPGPTAPERPSITHRGLVTATHRNSDERAPRADGLHSHLVDRLFRRKKVASVTAKWLAYLNKAATLEATMRGLSFALVCGYYHILYFRLPCVIESKSCQETHSLQHVRRRTWRDPCGMWTACRPPGPKFQPPHSQAFALCNILLSLFPLRYRVQPLNSAVDNQGLRCLRAFREGWN